MRTTRLIFGFLGALAVAGAHAEPITNPKYAYSLEFGPGWTVDRQREFSVSHTDGSSFTGTQPDPSGTMKSLKVAALTIQFLALAAGYCGNKSTTEFELSGPGWTGQGFHCNNRPNDRGVASQTIGFAVKRGETYYPFLLLVPRQDWTTNSESYLSLLRSLRFRQ